MVGKGVYERTSRLLPCVECSTPTPSRGVRIKCDGCHERARRSAQWRYKLKHRYNITPEVWQQMYDDQDGACMVCGEYGHRLVVDHDHSCCPEKEKTCGKCIRALLCTRCNSGHFGDRVVLSLARAEYLRANDFR